MRLGDPPSFAPVANRLEVYPWLRFKLDGTPDWPGELIEQLVETGAVASIDFKGAYKGTPVDVDTDPAFYRRIAEAFPDAWLEDPDLTVPEADAALEPHRDRITWDAPIHSVGDIEALAFPPRTVNVKPSRFGSVEALFAGYDYCDAKGIEMYGGGQIRARRRARPDPAARRALPSRRGQRHRAVGLRLGRVPPRPRAEPAGSEARADRHAPADIESRHDAAQAAPDQDGEQVRALGHAEARRPLRRGARGRDALPRRCAGHPRRARRRAHGRQALARALPRRDRRGAPAGAPPAAADGRGVAGARRAPRGRPQGRSREARPDPADQPSAAGRCASWGSSRRRRARASSCGSAGSC